MLGEVCISHVLRIKRDNMLGKVGIPDVLLRRGDRRDGQGLPRPRGGSMVVTLLGGGH